MKKNPAVKSMASLMLYLLLLIVLWYAIGMVAFPKPSREERLKAYVGKHQNLLIQVAENAMDEDQWTGIRNTVEVMELLKEENISDVLPYEQGAAFMIAPAKSSIQVQARILYLPDGQYAMNVAGDWHSAEVEKDGALRWEDGAGGYVRALRLADGFYLEDICLS